MKPKAVLAYCREKGIRSVDLRFPDIGGNWKHVTFPVGALTENAFESGFGQELTQRGLRHETREQMVLIPIAEAHYVDPLVETPTLVILASIHDALTREESWTDSRAVAARAVQYLQATGVADTALVRARFPFTLRSPHATESEGVNASYAPRATGLSYLGSGAMDPDFPFRSQVVLSAAEAGVGIERHYRGERASSEIVLSTASLLDVCDDLMMTRYMVEQLAALDRFGLVHANLSISVQWELNRSGDAIFSGSSHQGLSDLGWHALGGILRHATALAAIGLASPTLSCETEYRWRPIVASDQDDALCNVILGYHDPRQRAIEYRGSPSLGNPYLQMAATLMAMIDGIQNKLPANWSSAEESQTAQLPPIATGETGLLDVDQLQRSLLEDRDFLLLGNVFSDEILDVLVQYLRPGSAPQP